MRFNVPELAFNNILEFDSKIRRINPDEEVIFDFSQMSNFDPLPMLTMGAIIKAFFHDHPDTPYKIEGYYSTGKSYAGYMGFFKYAFPNSIYGKEPGQASGSLNYIPITPIKIDELQKTEHDKGNYIALAEMIEKEAGRLASVLDRGDKELHKLLTYLIREILRNTPEHAATNTMWICGQNWNTHNLAEIAIIDEGIGIYKSITKNASHKEYITDNATALQWALKAGISEAFKPSMQQKSDDTWANSGFGLYMVNEICNHLKGEFSIISYDDYLAFNDYKKRSGKTFFKGTAICMRIRPSEIKNASSLISQIASNGESEAKNIRTAFKAASIPSKGLMSDLNIQ